MLGLITLTSCTHMVTYDFSNTQDYKEKVVIDDKRREEDKLGLSGCKNVAVTRIADEYILPSKLDLLKQRMDKNDWFKDGTEIKLNTFNIGLFIPVTCAVSKASAISGGLSAIGVYGYMGADIGNVEDGVYCDIEYSIGKNKFKGHSFVAAESGIKELMGMYVRPDGLLDPIKKAVDRCIESSLNQKI